VARAQGAVEQIIRQRVAEHPDATWLKWQDTEVAWRDVLSKALRAANGLLELGVRPGERVAILMGNRPEFLWAHLGIVFIGAASVPVNISQRGPALQHILMDSSAAAVIFTDDLRDVLAALADDLPGLRHTVVCGGPAGRGADWDFDRLMSAADCEPDIELAEPTGSVGMMYTSGTTGPAEGRDGGEVRHDAAAGAAALLRGAVRRDHVHAAAPLPRERAARVGHWVDDPGRQARPCLTVQRLPILGRLPPVRGGGVQHARRDDLDPAEAAARPG
jgi:non-ribosomal peptide synthetase component F